MKFDPQLQSIDVVLNDNVCWICGEKFNEDIKEKSMTRHHGLPQFLKSKKNVLIPIHFGCHDKLNSNDIPTLISFSHNIDDSFKGLSRKVNALTNAMWKYLNSENRENRNK